MHYNYHTHNVQIPQPTGNLEHLVVGEVDRLDHGEVEPVDLLERKALLVRLREREGEG